MFENRYNVVVLGKTGVGKSSFINYLYGEPKFNTGVGKPVTKVGFHELEFTLNELPIRIFDTWGLEAGKSDKWLKELEKELLKRSTNESVESWFHTIFYCISGGGHRIEQFEIDIINKFIKNNYSVNVIFTKSDQSSKNELEELTNALKKSVTGSIKIIPVCSEDKELLNGNKITQFGKEDVINQTYFDFWNAIALRLPERCEKVILAKIKFWESEQIKYIKENVGIFNEDEIWSELVKRSKEFQKRLNNYDEVFDEISKTIQMYSFFASKLRLPLLKHGDSEKVIELIIQPVQREAFSFFKGLIFILASFITLPYSLLTAKSENEEILIKNLNNAVENVTNDLRKLKPKIREIIESIKMKGFENQY